MNENVREKAAGLADSAKEQVRSQFDQKKGTALGEIDTLVSALRRAGSELGDSGGMSGRVIDTVASRLESFSRSLDGKDLNGVLQGVETFARRNPAAFLGSAIAVGFLASRFLKSSGGGSAMQQYRDDYAGAGYATSYGSDREFAPIPPARPSAGVGMGSGYGAGAAPSGGSDFASPTSGSVIDTPLDFGTTSSDFGSTTGTTGTTGRKGGGSGNSGGMGNTGRQ